MSMSNLQKKNPFNIGTVEHHLYELMIAEYRKANAFTGDIERYTSMRSAAYDKGDMYADSLIKLTNSDPRV